MPALGLLLFMKTIRDNTPGQKVRWNKNYLIFIFLPKKVKKIGKVKFRASSYTICIAIIMP